MKVLKFLLIVSIAFVATWVLLRVFFTSFGTVLIPVVFVFPPLLLLLSWYWMLRDKTKVDRSQKISVLPRILSAILLLGLVIVGVLWFKK